VVDAGAKPDPVRPAALVWRQPVIVEPGVDAFQELLAFTFEERSERG
jgi:hypothetical protein